VRAGHRGGRPREGRSRTAYIVCDGNRFRRASRLRRDIFSRFRGAVSRTVGIWSIYPCSRSLHRSRSFPSFGSRSSPRNRCSYPSRSDRRATAHGRCRAFRRVKSAAFSGMLVSSPHRGRRSELASTAASRRGWSFAPSSSTFPMAEAQVARHWELGTAGK